jgi:hypothetical protein
MATLTINVSGQKIVPVPLSANLTQLLLTDALDGQVVTLEFQQNSTGGFTVASTQLNGLNQPGAGANAVSLQSFQYTALTNSWNRVPTPNGVVQTLTASGAAAVLDGITLLGSAGALSITLALPVAGEQDGVTMKFIATTAHAHVITTPADGIDGVGDTITFGGAIGDCAELEAHAGVWYLIGGLGVALTEV